jgi:hypothetical protein
MEDEVIMEFLASEFLAEKKRLPNGTEIDALAIRFQAGTKLMNQLIEEVIPEDEEN